MPLNPSTKKTLKDPSALSKLKREALIQQNFSQHECIMRLHKVFEDDEHLYFFFDLADVDLYTWIFEKTEGPLKYKDIYFIAVSMAGALSHLHSLAEPVIFRDLQPENILCTLDSKNNLQKVQLSDFGESRQLHYRLRQDGTQEHSRQMTRHFALTANYASPEMNIASLLFAIGSIEPKDEEEQELIELQSKILRKRQKKIGLRSDVWSFGMLLLVLLTKETPREHPESYDADEWGQLYLNQLEENIKDSYPPFIIDLTKKCLNPEPSLRPTSTQILSILEENPLNNCG